MKCFQLLSHKNPAQITTAAVPSVNPGEVLIETHACGLNFADILMSKGTYQDTPKLPLILGMELSGRIIDVAAGMDKGLVGTRIAAFSGQGGLAEYVSVPFDRCVPLPDQMPYDHAAAFQIAYGTSHVALGYKARLHLDETLLVLGASGGVGLTAVEIGKLMGATVIACARGADKLAIAKQAGADHLIDTDTQDIRKEVKALGGADVVYDPIGGDQYTAAFRACNPDARYLVIGFASGDIPEVKPNHMLVKNISLMGLYWGGYLKFKPQVVTDSMTQLFTWYTEGKLTPHISHKFPLDQAAEALETLRTRKSTGKVVVEIDQA